MKRRYRQQLIIININMNFITYIGNLHFKERFFVCTFAGIDKN